MSNEEKKIIKLVKQGDISSFSILVERYQEMAFTLALSIIKNREDAEEIAQDAFVKAYKNLSSFKGKSKFSTWLYQIVYRTSLSKLRVNKPGNKSIDDLKNKELDLNIYEENRTDRIDKKKILKSAIQQLNEDEGFLIILYYYQELTVEEIAQCTEFSVSNIKVKLFRARKNLFNIMQKLMNGKAQELIY